MLSGALLVSCSFGKWCNFKHAFYMAAFSLAFLAFHTYTEAWFLVDLH